jgi:L-ascorbate 6-phosphate lactonase
MGSFYFYIVKNKAGLSMKTGKNLIEDINSCVLQPGQAAFWWLGQIGFALKLGETVLYLDAYLAPSEKRTVPPLLTPQGLDNADLICGSHNHLDHIDWPLWQQLASNNPQARFIAPRALEGLCRSDAPECADRFVGLNDGETATVRDIRVTGVAAAHEFLDRDPETGLYPYLGYVIEGNGCTIYHAGDTCIYEGLHNKLRRYPKIDIMILPINGRDAGRYRSNIIGNMTYQEAADLAGALKPGLAIPAHYDMFADNSENPILFTDYLNAKYPGQHCWVGGYGERVIYTRIKTSD